MTDDLRTRIAAVMEAHDVNSDCGCPGLITNWFDHMADAVIAEVGGDFWFDKSERMQRFALLHGKSHDDD